MLCILQRYKMWWKEFSILIICSCISTFGQLNKKRFPTNFLFGTASSAYQIEGAWNVSGKGENIWDRFTHDHPEKIMDRTNGDIACNSYHKFKEDIVRMKEIGIQFYRFSLSWSRILPTGLSYKINKDGIRYYNEVIDLLLENDIIPMITLFHWDTPQPLEDLGGFANDKMINWFDEYAKVAFNHFGDRVKLWLTFNEPRVICLRGYGQDRRAPGYNSSGIGDYMCTHNLIKAHAKVYHTYNDQYKPQQKGKLSITIDAQWYKAATESKEDIAAAQRLYDFTVGIFADPIFHPKGDYPESIKKIIGERSKAEGFSQSRLPKFNKEEVQYIRGTYDFYGLNHYVTLLVSNVKEYPIGDPSFIKDVHIHQEEAPNWPSGVKGSPLGFRKILNYIKNRYGDIDIYVTENGFSDKGEINDYGRINYYGQYLSALLDAIQEDNVNVKAYAAWTLLDNFEWEEGYVNRFGLFHVDFNDPERPRTPKLSAKFMKQVISGRSIP